MPMLVKRITIICTQSDYCKEGKIQSWDKGSKFNIWRIFQEIIISSNWLGTIEQSQLDLYFIKFIGELKQRLPSSINILCLVYLFMNFFIKYELFAHNKQFDKCVRPHDYCALTYWQIIWKKLNRPKNENILFSRFFCKSQ